jgi:ATP-binding cassette subfamily B protein/subfamily B ATP-binding cassette protein MsbA
MRNFGRVLRLALVHRWDCLVAVVCAAIVAVLWGGNIGAVAPVVEVAFRNQSIQDWIEREMKAAQTASRNLAAEMAWLRGQLAAGAGDSAENQSELETAQERWNAEQRALLTHRKLLPYAERYLPDDPFQTLLWIVALFMAGTLLKNLFLYLSCLLEHRLAQLTVFDLSKLFFRRTLRMDLSDFGNDGAAQLLSRFTYDMECVSAGLKSLFGKFTREPLKMITCLVGAGMICPRLLMVSMLIAPAAAYLMTRLGKLLKKANRRAMEEMSQIYNILEESFQGIKVVKAFTMERYERWRFHEKSKDYFKRSMRIARYDSMTRPATELMGIATIALALMAGAYLVLKQETRLFGIPMCDRPLSLSSLLLFYGLLAGVSDPARKLSEVFGRIQRSAAACDRIFAVIDREPVIVDPPTPKPFRRHRQGISFSNVSFRYPSGGRVLENVDLEIPFGETLAIVGHNGCGKTTLVNLIPRFFDVESGRVLIDGTDVREMRIRDLRSQIGLVTQETLLFDDTVANNIRYGRPGATLEQVMEAARQAHADRFITEKLENGYDTLVGARGDRLSGGQRQRIALARAIIRDPDILILDEATSQIDVESEQLIHRVLEQFLRNRTTLLITHRMSTLALADRILVLDRGRIAGLGTHDELLRSCDLYRRLSDIQFRESA